MVSQRERSARPRVGVLSIHPAPYRDPVFTAVHRRGLLDLHVLSMSPHCAGHPYWREPELAYPNRFLGKGFHLSANVSIHPRIFGTLIRGRYDALAIPGYNHLTSQIAIAYCLATRTPFVYYTDGVLITPSSTIHRSSRDKLQRFIMNRAATVWVPGAASRAYAHRYGVPDERIFEGCYCLDADVLQVVCDRWRVKRQEVRAQMGFGPQDCVFLFVGRMIHERGLGFLADAFRILRARHADVRLVVVGLGPERTLLETLAGNPKSGVCVLDPMPIEEVSAYYAAADAYVLSSICETYSLALAHAALAGLPMIATDRVGAVPDYVFDGETGFVVPAGEVAPLVEAMERLHNMGPARRDMGVRARTIAARRTTDWGANQLESAVLTAVTRGTGIMASGRDSAK